MRYTLCFGICSVLVVVNQLIGHFAAPNGIFLTALLIPALALCIVIIGDELPPLYKSAAVYLFTALNDIGLKLWAGGTHDSAGQGWINMFLIIGATLGFAFLALHLSLEKEAPRKIRIYAALLFPALFLLHLLLFAGFGVNVHYGGR